MWSDRRQRLCNLWVLVLAVLSSGDNNRGYRTPGQLWCPCGPRVGIDNFRGSIRGSIHLSGGSPTSYVRWFLGE